MNEREVFLTVVDEQGFSSAAIKLDTTPAAVSRKVKKLEERLGVRLLHRTTRSIRLTPEGELYYQQAKSLLKKLNTLEQDLGAKKGQLNGKLKVAAPMSFGQKKLASIMTQFAIKYPKLRISLILEDQEVDIIKEGYDLAIRICYPVDSSFIGRKIMDVPLQVCASPEYLSKNGCPEKPSDLKKHQCLHYNLVSERDEWRFNNQSKTEVIEINSRFCSNNGEALTQAAIDGLGILIMPEFIVKEPVSSGKLIRILEGFERPPLGLYAIYPTKSHLPAKTRKLIDFIVDQFA